MINRVYMGYCKDELIRSQSASGGIFPVIANLVVSQGGVVYGAVYNENYHVCHIRATDQKSVHLMAGSKYVQSELKETFTSVSEDISKGILTLFSGTPCQVAGLKSFLRQKRINSDKLICIDFVCHGVPSKTVWEAYLQYICGKKSNIESINLCDKGNGWDHRHVLFEFNGGKKYYRRQKEDIYIKAFVKNWSLRPSCFECKFKYLSSESDIKIGDFWKCPVSNEKDKVENGISLIVVNSHTGAEVLKSVEKHLILRDSTISDISLGNPYFIKSVAHDNNRELFMNLVCAKNVGIRRAYLLTKLKEKIFH